MRPPGEYLVGTVVGVRDSSVTIRADGTADTTVVELKDVFQLGVSRGFGHAGVKGALIGGVGGSLIGALVAKLLPGRECETVLVNVSPFTFEEQCTGLTTIGRLFGIVTPGLVGGLTAGYIIGRGTPVERWDLVWLEGMPVTLGIGATDGVLAAVRITF